MLAELRLKRFGRFSDKSFALGATTLFFGQNEAGKTTVFDALCQALCRPRGNHRLGKLLHERYGGELDSAVLAEDGQPEPEPRFDEDEFTDLYSIRANDLSFSLEAGPRWLERLKSKLFTGGLDPARLAAELEKKASDKGTYRHNRELAKLASERQRLRDRLETRHVERQELLQTEKDLAALQGRLAALGQDKSALEGRLAETEADLQREEKIRLGRKLRSQLRLLKRRQELQKEQQQLEPYRKSRIHELDRMGAAISSEKERLQAEIGRRQALAEHQLTQEQELARLAERLEEMTAVARRGAILLDRIDAFHASPPQVELREWKRSNWAIGALIAVGAVSAALLLEGAALRVIILAGGFAVTALLWALGTRTHQVVDTAAEEAFFQRIREDYLQRDPGRQSLLDLASLRAQLRKEQAEYAELERRRAHLRSSVEKLREQITSLSSGADGLLRKSSALELEYQQWLEQLQVSSRDEYLARVGDWRRGNDALEQVEHELAPEALADPEEFELECERKLRALDEEGISRQGISDEALQELRRQRDTLSRERERLEVEARALFVEKEQASARTASGLDRLDHEIIELEDRLHRVDAQIYPRELDKRAAALAKRIFTQIQGDSSARLTTLAGELQHSFAQILPDQREVRLLDLSDSSLGVSDVSGELRSLEQLSTGTRDAFVLAARLALAKKADPDKGLLLLDEPFLTLDRQREKRALELLRRFQQETGWQLVFFTKEPQLKRHITATFEGAVVHEIRP